MPRPLLAYSSGVFARLTPAEAVRRLAERGVGVVELSHVNFEYTDGGWTELLRDAVRACTEEGLRVVAVHAPTSGVAFRTATSGDYEVLARFYEPWIRAGAELGAVVVIHTLSPPISLDDDHASYHRRLLELNSKVFSTLAELALNLGTKVAVETRYDKGAFGSAPGDLKALIERVSKESVGVCLDVGHVHANGFPPHEVMEYLNGLVLVMHVHDNDGKRDRHEAPFTGTVDWYHFLRKVAELGFRGPMILEVYCREQPERCLNTLTLVDAVSRKMAELLEG